MLSMVWRSAFRARSRLVPDTKKNPGNHLRLSGLSMGRLFQELSAFLQLLFREGVGFHAAKVFVDGRAECHPVVDYYPCQGQRPVVPQITVAIQDVDKKAIATRV